MTLRALRTDGFRVAILYGLVFTLAMGGLGALTLRSAQLAMENQIIDHANSELGILRAIYIGKDIVNGSGISRVQQYVRRHSQHGTSLDFISLQMSQGGAPKLVGNLPPLRLTAARQYIPNPNLSSRTILVTGTMLAPGIYAFSGTDLKYVHIIGSQIFINLVEMLLGILILAPLGGFLLSRRFMARTDAIAHTCQEIMAGNLNTRIHVDNRRDELDRLARIINAMLDRIASLMDSLRQVSSDVAHDLRTPLTNLRHGLERGKAEDVTPAQHAATLDRAIAASDELLALFAAVLRITQIEGGGRRSGFASVDLDLLLQKVVDVYHAVAEDAGHALKLEIPEAFSVRGDHSLLFQMVSNLVENAIVHTPSGTNITIRLAGGSAEAIVHVLDDGPGLPIDEQAKVFQRFYRRESSRSQPGYGLGLSLVLAVAELHGGSAILVTPSDGIGIDATVTLPMQRRSEDICTRTSLQKPASARWAVSLPWGHRV